MNTNLKTATKKLMLDFHQRNCQTVLAKEYDKGSRFIPIQCMEYGEPFTLNSSIEIQVKVLTPDNRALLEHSAVIQNDGSILLELTENMLFYPGKATVELIFYDFEHKKRLSPMKFDLLIDSSAYPDDRVVSSDEFNALTDLLEKANADYTYVITAARESADAAKISEDNAATSANTATKKATQAALSASNAENAANRANISANNASHSETASATNAASALNSAKESESWAHGNTGIREGENTNNSKYWSEQSKDYADSWKGSLLPQGTIGFSQLPTSGSIAGHMYNINEAFVTDSRFKDGTGYSYPAGTNVYWTQDNKWDCLSGTLTKTLTQVEYNNLTHTEKMNGTIYYISDADNSISNANENVAGLMSQKDKKKLDGIAEGAEVNVQADWNITDSNSDAYIKNKPTIPLAVAVKGNAETSYRAGNVNITAANIGLGNVNNTPDYLKSVQSATYLSNWGDTRNIETKPSDYSEKFKPVGLKTPTASKITTGSSFATLVGIRGWSDASAGKAHELAFDGNGKLLHRVGLTSWEGWREIAHIDDLNPENIGALSLNGGTMNNDANVTFESGNYTVNIKPSELILSNGNKQIYIMQGNGINSPSIKLINVDSAYEYDENVEIKSSYINITDNSSGEKLQINADNIKTKTTFTINTNNVNNHSLIINGSTKSIYSGTAIYDEKYNLGTSNRKWNDIYAQNGVIQTSDRTNKMDIKNLDIEVIKAFIMGLIPSSYKMLDGTSGRTHYGFIAQDIEELMNTLNMDSSDFAGFIKSPKKAIKYEDENGIKLENPVEEVLEGEYDYALRYDEFIAPLIKVVQEQQKTIEKQQRTIEQQQIIIENQQKEIEQIKKDISKIYSSI